VLDTNVMPDDILSWRLISSKATGAVRVRLTIAV
jgi:hypothetical protein